MKRLLALDAFRGFTVVGMILVNVPGDWSYVYAPLLHSKWNGLTLADLVFPFFIFIMGVSVMLSFTKAVSKGAGKKSLMHKIIKRSLIIFTVGVFLNLIAYRFQELRIPGVLQRIAIVYFIIATMFIHLNRKQIYGIGLVMLICYWIIMIFIPIPGEATPNLEPGKNWSNYIDNLLIPFKQHGGTWDPEGLLSTIPSICTAILGLQLGETVLNKELNTDTIKVIFITGSLLISIGFLWSFSFPVNKNIWSCSYVLLTGGIANLLLALFIYLIDIKSKYRWAAIGFTFGSNALVAYIFHYLLIIPFSWMNIEGKNIQEWFMHIIPELDFSLKFSSLLWAILFTTICYLPMRWMDKRRIFVKI